MEVVTDITTDVTLFGAWKEFKKYICNNRVYNLVHSQTVVSVSKHYTNNTKRVGLVQSRSNHHFTENRLVLAMI